MEAALPLSRAKWAQARFSYLLKLAAAALLIVLADRLFYEAHQAGWTVGVFALALILSAVALHPEMWRRADAKLSAGAAALFAFFLFDDPGLLALALCWSALGLAVLLPRSARFASGWFWILRLVTHTLTLPARPFVDIRRLRRSARRSGSVNLGRSVPTLALPMLGSLVFLLLFVWANPLIEEAFGSVEMSGASFLRVLFWLLILMPIWAVLRPRLWFRGMKEQDRSGPLALPGVSTASVILSLIAFNSIFAVQNALDIAFLWSGAPLPEGVSLADYAHRGAYPLIGTALLAALFVLVTLRPGSAMAASALIRRLVTLWIGQNVFLVASAVLRTIDYVEAYSLTELRIEALIWMGLVAVGLLLICARLWLGKSDTWLINANMAAATLVLSVSAAADYDRLAAGWNVRHAREAGGPGASLDLCYLHQMGASALLPLIELEGRPLPPVVRERVTWLRNGIMDRLEARQARWDGWTWRGARRLDAARRAIAEQRLPRFKAAPRRCDGVAVVTTSAAAASRRRIEVTPPPPPLTATPPR